MADSNYYSLDNVHMAVPVLIINFVCIIAIWPSYTGWSDLKSITGMLVIIE